MPRERLLLTMAAVLLLALALSFVHPYDRTTWLMETAPIFIAPR